MLSGLIQKFSGTFCLCIFTLTIAVSPATAQVMPAPPTVQANDSSQATEAQQAEFARRLQQQQQQLEAQQMQDAQQRIAEPPFPPLPAEQEQYRDELLAYWQQSSEQIKQYTADFQRYEYDTEIVNYRDPQSNQLAAHSIGQGQIRYSSPDKGYYETTQIWDFAAPPKAPGEEAEFKLREGEQHHERWICDGRNIYEYDFESKRLYETEIPAEMQGDGLANSPLPFLFGANKQQLLSRYWVRVITPAGTENEYWLEAWPKRVDDARNYSRIEIIIAQEDFLPKAMHIYSPQYDPQKNNFASRYFAFENRQVNGALAKFKDFGGFFVRPQTPVLGGWQRVKRSALQQQQATQEDLNRPNAAGQQPNLR